MKFHQAFTPLIAILLVAFTSCNNKPANHHSDPLLINYYDNRKSPKLTEHYFMKVEDTDSITSYWVVDSIGNKSGTCFKQLKSNDSLLVFDYHFRLIDQKNFDVRGQKFTVQKFEHKDGLDGDLTVFFAKDYGPIFLQEHFGRMYVTYDRPNRVERELIERIKSDTLGFGGI